MGYTVASVITFPSTLPAEEIQLYTNTLDCVLLLPLYLTALSSSWYLLMKGKSHAQTLLASTISTLSPAVTLHLNLFFSPSFSVVGQGGTYPPPPCTPKPNHHATPTAGSGAVVPVLS